MSTPFTFYNHSQQLLLSSLPRSPIFTDGIENPKRIHQSLLSVFCQISPPVAAMALSLERYTDLTSSTRLSRFLRERSKKERERSGLIAIEGEVCLPEGLIIEILSWLPVKDLLQLKSVCKSWYAIISSRDFVSRHLNNSNNDTWSHCLFAQYYATLGELDLYELLLDETPPRVLAYNELELDSMICGPCDGLYYLFSYNQSDQTLT